MIMKINVNISGSGEREPLLFSIIENATASRPSDSLMKRALAECMLCGRYLEEDFAHRRQREKRATRDVTNSYLTLAEVT